MRVAVVTWILGIVLLIMPNLVFSKPYGAYLCRADPQFICHTVKRGENWNNLFKDPDRRDLVMRLNRTNNIHPGMKIAIPPDPNLGMMDISPLPKQIDPPGEKIIYVSLHDLAFGAYDESGTLQYWGPVSGGQEYCPDIGRRCTTHTGKFTIYRKEGSGCVSTKFPVGRGGAPMPYCMYFYNGFALHGSYEVPGYNASHGCVRMFVNDAKWLNQEFLADDIHVAVIINE